MNPKVDPYVRDSVNMIGVTATAISLQNYAAECHRQIVFSRTVRGLQYHGRGAFGIPAVEYQKAHAWASRNARLLMGIEE